MTLQVLENDPPGISMEYKRAWHYKRWRTIHLASVWNTSAHAITSVNVEALKRTKGLIQKVEILMEPKQI